MTAAATRAQGATRGQSSNSAAVVTRFAPSPTGLLHLGHAYSAIRAHDLARAGGGCFLLRIEDIDGGRSRAAFVDAIYADLHWLGLAWDGVSVQSTHAARYAAALARLRDMGLAYRCICTRAEIAASASAPHGDIPPPYPGTCRGKAVDDAIPAAWRLDVARAATLAGSLGWHDSDAGRIAADPLRWGDVVIARKDALASYHLAVTVDDAAAGVTDVVRGRDLFEATHVHRLLQALLGLPVPRYHHHPLVTGADSRRLAKRDRAAALAVLRDQGVDGKKLADDLRAGRLPIGFGLASP